MPTIRDCGERGKKLVALVSVLAAAACGGGDADADMKGLVKKIDRASSGAVVRGVMPDSPVFLVSGEIRIGEGVTLTIESSVCHKFGPETECGELQASAGRSLELTLDLKRADARGVRVDEVTSDWGEGRMVVIPCLAGQACVAPSPPADYGQEKDQYIRHHEAQVLWTIWAKMAYFARAFTDKGYTKETSAGDPEVLKAAETVTLETGPIALACASKAKCRQIATSAIALIGAAGRMNAMAPAKKDAQSSQLQSIDIDVMRSRSGEDQVSAEAVAARLSGRLHKRVMEVGVLNGAQTRTFKFLAAGADLDGSALRIRTWACAKDSFPCKQNKAFGGAVLIFNLGDVDSETVHVDSGSSVHLELPFEIDASSPEAPTADGDGFFAIEALIPCIDNKDCGPFVADIEELARLVGEKSAPTSEVKTAAPATKVSKPTPAKTAEKAAELTGLWELYVPTQGGSYSRWRLEFKSDGRYRFTDAANGASHEGTFTAVGGAWTLSGQWTIHPVLASGTAYADGGSFQLLAPDALRLQGRFGTAVWRRPQAQ